MSINMSFQYGICEFVYLYFVGESIVFERHLSCSAISISSQGASQALRPKVEEVQLLRENGNILKIEDSVRGRPYIT